jgi:hypothetical protein
MKLFFGKDRKKDIPPAPENAANLLLIESDLC